MRLLSSCYCVTRCTLDEQPFWAKEVFLLFRLGTRDRGNEVDHVSNVQPVDDIDVQRFIPRQDGAKRTLNLMKLMSPIVYFYHLHGQLTWHGKILQCTKNGLLMSTRVLRTETKIPLLLSFHWQFMWEKIHFILLSAVQCSKWQRRCGV